MTNISFESWESRKLRDPAFRAAVKRLWVRYQLARLWQRVRMLFKRGAPS